MKKIFAAILFFLVELSIKNGIAAPVYVPFAGEKTTWHSDFERFDYEMDDETFEITPFKRPDNEKFAVGTPQKGKRRCIVVVPKEAATGNPWSWQGCYWDHEPQTETELLRRGFHVVFITPDPGKQWDAWYQYLTEKHGLSSKPAFVGMSKGGVNEYDWATANPDKVSCIYADNPAIRPEAFNKLGDLVKNDVALLNVCGSQDFLLQRHTLPIEERYRQLGGLITVVIKDGPAHHPHSIRNPKLIADWMTSHMQPRASDPKPEFVDETFSKSYYYNGESTNIFLKEERIFADARGPGFVDCFDRYEALTKSQWGIRGMTIIVPKMAAAGKPWVLRANAITRDAALDQKLLARGFHIVIPPLTEQVGPVAQQWDAVYKVMVEHGFAKGAALEGIRTGAGEVYAWAIENPDKVSCIVAENPVLRALVTKKPILENLAPLAKAGLPVMHVCDASGNGWYDDNSVALQKAFESLGGKYSMVGRKDVDGVADFVAAKVH